MATAAHALGRLFDLTSAVSVIDGSAGDKDGNRIRLNNADGIAFVAFFDAGSAGDDLSFDLQEHNASSGGTSQDLDIITVSYIKTETTLDADETWTKITQTVASEVIDPGATGTTAEEENIWVVEVLADQLSDGFDWISLNLVDFGSASTKFGGVLGILFDLADQRTPENLVTTQ